MFAISAAPLFGAIALGVDYTIIHQKTSELQEAADSAALSSTRELGIANITQDEILPIAKSYAEANFQLSSHENIDVEANVLESGKTVEIKLSYHWKPFIAHMFDSRALPIVVTSSATSVSGSTSICVLSLNKTETKSMYMNKKSSILAPGCAIYANSKSSIGMEIDTNSKMEANAIFVSGGYELYSKLSYSPTPITDAPQIDDPLANRAAPPFGGCDYSGYTTTEDATISPGVYCGGIDVGEDAILNLEPGEYIVKDGDLSVRGNASLIGENVGFYFTGISSTFDFGVSTQAVLSAPKTGALAGILFFEDRASEAGKIFTIRSKDAEKFEGVIYLPNSTLFIDKASRVGQASNWTAIIVDKLDIGMGPNLVINSNYAGSDVPVPEGVGDAPSGVRLKN